MTKLQAKKLKRMKKRNVYLKQKYKILGDKEKYKITYKLPSTSKLILWVVVLFCLEIVIFSEWAMIKTGDTSALYALIGVPATLIPTVLGYYHKAAKENCEGGVVYATTVNRDNSQSVNNDNNEIDNSNAAG